MPHLNVMLAVSLGLALSGAAAGTVRAIDSTAAAAEAPTAAGTPAAFKLYPGATRYTPPETEQTKLFESSLPAGTTITAYFTDDPFDKVVAFYRGIGKEYRPQHMKRERLPDGKPIQRAFVIFDGAADLRRSTSWARIQHPFIGSTSEKGETPEYQDVREVTEIVVTVKKPVPRPKNQANPSRDP
jgi:hypothetical protein